jgi:hypothetical protein
MIALWRTVTVPRKDSLWCGCVVGSQLRKLCEEPVAILEEPVLMDSVELVPVQVGFLLKLLNETNTNGLNFAVLRIRIRGFFTPRIRDPGWSNGRIRDKQTKFVNSLYTKIGRIRDPVLFYPRIRDGAMVGSGSGIKHPGSATLY